jgi:hypothetical protein
MDAETASRVYAQIDATKLARPKRELCRRIQPGLSEQ